MVNVILLASNIANQISEQFEERPLVREVKHAGL